MEGGEGVRVGGGFEVVVRGGWRGYDEREGRVRKRIRKSGML